MAFSPETERVEKRVKNAEYFLDEKEEKMLLVQIKKEITPLSRVGKLQLIEEISKMSREEELAKHFTPDAEYPVFTPYNEEKAATQLQQFLDQSHS